MSETCFCRLSLSAVVVINCLLMTGCLKRTLLDGLSEESAREAVIALSKGDVRASIVKVPKARGQAEDTWNVEVQGGDRTQVEAWRILHDNGLPRRKETGVEEVYRNSQLIPTATEERAKFLLAQGGELSRTLKTIPGVVDARVHVVIPDPSSLRDPNDKVRPSASVLLKYWSNYREPPQDQVRKLVANGVEGLQEDRIAVLSTGLNPPVRDNRAELASLLPTVGLAVDYFYWFGTLFVIAVTAWATLSFLPGAIRWCRTQIECLRESWVE